MSFWLAKEMFLDICLSFLVGEISINIESLLVFSWLICLVSLTGHFRAAVIFVIVPIPQAV